MNDRDALYELIVSSQELVKELKLHKNDIQCKDFSVMFRFYKSLLKKMKKRFGKDFGVLK